MELVGHLFAARPKPCIQRTPRHHAGPQPPQSSKRHPLTEATQERDSVTSQPPPPGFPTGCPPGLPWRRRGSMRRSCWQRRVTVNLRETLEPPSDASPESIEAPLAAFTAYRAETGGARSLPLAGTPTPSAAGTYRNVRHVVPRQGVPLATRRTLPRHRCTVVAAPPNQGSPARFASHRSLKEIRCSRLRAE